MSQLKRIEWVLRVAVFGEFLGHSMFAFQGKASWIGWIEQLLPVSTETTVTILTIVAFMDLAVALFVLISPMRPVVLWAALWGFWTALMRPIVGESIWDFVERWANWGAPLALFFLMQLEEQPKKP